MEPSIPTMVSTQTRRFNKTPMVSKMTKLLGQLLVTQTENGYSVINKKGLRVGPNPVSKRGAELILRILEVLGLDYRYPQPATARQHNSEIVRDAALLDWLHNRSVVD